VITLTLAELAAATGGRLHGDVDPGSMGTGPVVADSRSVLPGALFVALRGERVDGHDFAAAATAAGAAAVLAGRPVGVPAVIVDDPLVALGLLARAVLDRLPGVTVIGVTGSSGKTTTKDLLAAVLADVGPTVAPVGSFNNELGLPLTALRCGRDTRFLVAEMGARGPGQLSHLCGITPPGMAVVLNVGAAHVGVFGSIDETAAAKAELPAALRPGGVAVLNADDPRVAAMRPAQGARVVTFGATPGAAIRAEQVSLDEAARAAFRLVTPSGQAQVRLRLHGGHQVANALAAAVVGLEVGLEVARVAELLSAAEPTSRWRMEVTTRADGVVVVNDAYNANPDSVRAALAALVAMGGRAGHPGAGRRTWAVLGEMLELGPTSPDEHRAVGAWAARLGVMHLVAVGPGDAGLIRHGALREGLPPDGTAEAVPDIGAALALLAGSLLPGDVVLVKASRSVGLDALAERLLSDSSPSDGAPVSGAAARSREDVRRVGGHPAAARVGEGIS
jgi:UDP-N-acetylmuramoyl-tripeptide--D-alanyl-D-alanine ligase